jgi:hypothetical protein
LLTCIDLISPSSCAGAKSKCNSTTTTFTLNGVKTSVKDACPRTCGACGKLFFNVNLYYSPIRRSINPILIISDLLICFSNKKAPLTCENASQNPCMNGGTCVTTQTVTSEGFALQCTCPAKWTGESCETRK